MCLIQNADYDHVFVWSEFRKLINSQTERDVDTFWVDRFWLTFRDLNTSKAKREIAIKQSRIDGY